MKTGISGTSTAPVTPLSTQFTSERENRIERADFLEKFVRNQDQQLEKQANMRTLSDSDIIFQKPECGAAWFYGSLIFNSDSPSLLITNVLRFLERDFENLTCEVRRSDFTINCKKLYQEVDTINKSKKEICVEFDVKLYSIPESLLLTESERGKYYNLVLKKRDGDMFLFMALSNEIVGGLKKEFVREGY